jgi:hypothetical protein
MASLSLVTDCGNRGRSRSRARRPFAPLVLFARDVGDPRGGARLGDRLNCRVIQTTPVVVSATATAAPIGRVPSSLRSRRTLGCRSDLRRPRVLCEAGGAAEPLFPRGEVRIGRPRPIFHIAPAWSSVTRACEVPACRYHNSRDQRAPAAERGTSAALVHRVEPATRFLCRRLFGSPRLHLTRHASAAGARCCSGVKAAGRRTPRFRMSSVASDGQEEYGRPPRGRTALSRGCYADARTPKRLACPAPPILL